MARLNEPSVSSDSLDTLRKKMLRQNKDLAKSNNIRALRIRELENDCAAILSENLQLHGRILELEKQVEDNEARRIADHALVIKEKLESQLIEWETLIAGLGLEPPLKRHSPRITKLTRQRTSFYASRTSPSQRRLRDIAREIEELGHVPEIKSHPRQSMNHKQILALRSEAEAAESPALGPPPISKLIEEEPVKADSPTRAAAVETKASSSKCSLEPPISLPSPQADQLPKPFLLSPEKPRHVSGPQSKSQTKTAPPIKLGLKRKLSTRDDIENILMPQVSEKNQISTIALEKPPPMEKADKKMLNEFVTARESVQEGEKMLDFHLRPPLAAKSTNKDVRSPKKCVKSTKTSGAIAIATGTKLDVNKPKTSQARSKYRSKGGLSVGAVAHTGPPIALPPRSLKSPAPVTSPSISSAVTAAGVATSAIEPSLLLPSSPEVALVERNHRGDTPPPIGISSQGETTRPSRRSRAAISYAEPNLRDKMRRPSKQLFDAVAGEGKYTRQSSQVETLLSDVMCEGPGAETEADKMPPSPLAGKNSSPQKLPSSVVTERRRRPSSSTIIKAMERADRGTSKGLAIIDLGADADGSGDIDIHEFTSSSPQIDHGEVVENKSKKMNRRRTTASRRFSPTADEGGDDDGHSEEHGGERTSARRRTMV